MSSIRSGHQEYHLDIESTAHSSVSDPMLSQVLALWRRSDTEHWFTTEGDSMLPLIRHGDRVLVNYDLAMVRRGSVVVFRQDGRLVVHRIVRIKSGTPRAFITKGDNAIRFDRELTEDELIGHVLAVQSQGCQIDMQAKIWRITGSLTAMGTCLAARSYDRLRTTSRHYLGARFAVSAGRLQRMGRWVMQMFLTILYRAMWDR